MNFLAAFKFLTIIPLPYRGGDSAEEIGRSVIYFPVVGLVIGLVLAGLNWLLSLILPTAIVNGLLLVALVAISGALHLDGFADTCDGIAGHKPAEERWQVMHDSRVGAFGIVGIVLLLLVKYVAMNSIPVTLFNAILIVMPVISRWTMVYVIFAYPYARPDGLGKEVRRAVNRRRFAAATIITRVLVIAVFWLAGVDYFYLAGLTLMIGIWVIIIITAGYFKHMFSGLTGDTYGAINETAEVSALILMILLAYNKWLV